MADGIDISTGLWRTALHEAGHAVVSVLAARELIGDDRGFRSVLLSEAGGEVTPIGNWTWCDPLSLKGSPFIEGLSAHWSIFPHDHKARLLARMRWTVLFYLAGGAAELAVNGAATSKAEAWCPYRMEDDLKIVGGVVEDLNIVTNHRHELAEFKNEAIGLAREAWPAIEALAAFMFRAPFRAPRTRYLEFDDCWPTIAPLMQRQRIAEFAA